MFASHVGTANSIFLILRRPNRKFYRGSHKSQSVHYRLVLSVSQLVVQDPENVDRATVFAKREFDDR